MELLAVPILILAPVHASNLRFNFLKIRCSSGLLHDNQNVT